MKTEEIIAGNRLLAEFMKTKSSIVNDMYFGADGILYSVENLRYHFSWDWLMPVLDKIYKLEEYWVFVNDRVSPISDGEIAINTGQIMNTYVDVVEFVKWYKQQKNE